MTGPVLTKSTKNEKGQQVARRPHQWLRQSALAGPEADILTLQRAAGNRAVGQLLELGTIGSPLGEDGKPASIQSTQSTLNGDVGQQLDITTKGFMESLFGRDWSGVRIHTGQQAERSAGRMGAAAYTMGQNIVFNRGYFAPDSEDGLRLLAHELAHVAQWQNAGSPTTYLQGQTLDPLPQSAIEAEAHQVVEGLARGETANVQGAIQTAGPLRHPVYISRHGKRGFLENARRFYSRWGYSPITTGVDSVEEILADLAQKPRIARVTIVSHAHPTNLFMALFSGGGNQVSKTDWQIDTPEELLETETHFVSEQTLDDVIRDLRTDRTHRQRLRRIGSPRDPIVRQFLWWALEYVAVEGMRFSRRRRRRLRRLALRNMNRYRDTMLIAQAHVAGLGSGAPALSERDFERLRQSIRQVTRNLRWPHLGRGRRRRRSERRIERQLRRSPTRLINRVLRGSFFQDLDVVRRKIRRGSWIEIQGCRVGQDRDYLVQVQDFFANGNTRPKVSAPNWFQFFGFYGFTPVPDNRRRIRRLWQQRNVRRAFDYWFPIITGRPLPNNPTHDDLRDYLRTPHALPLAFPGRRGTLRRILRVLFLAGQGEDAFLEWLSKHAYRLTQVADIRNQLFTRRTLSANIRNSIVDWLQERRGGRTQMVFRPDPEYDRHIEEVN